MPKQHSARFVFTPLKRFYLGPLAILLLTTSCTSRQSSETVPSALPRRSQDRGVLARFATKTLDEDFLNFGSELPGFGGLFVENGVPVVRLRQVQSQDAVRRTLADFLTRYRAGRGNSRHVARMTELDIVFREARFDFAQLHSWRLALAQAAMAKGIVASHDTFPGSIVFDSACTCKAQPMKCPRLLQD